MTLRIEAISAFSDNYIWAVHDARYCVIVDPGEASGVLDFLKRRDLVLCGLLLTHHHHDHIGGVDEIRAHHPSPAWGPNDSRMPAELRVIGEGDRVSIEELDLEFRVIETPGHTTSHIAFYGQELLFCGDTLFSAGCGRLFEGTPQQMQESIDKLAALPDATRVYCAHEYTESNCRFARKVEPENRALAERCEAVVDLRRHDRITLPSTIGDEKAFNPFMRTRQPGVIDAAERQDSGRCGTPEDVFGVIRRWKDAC